MSGAKAWALTAEAGSDMSTILQSYDLSTRRQLGHTFLTDLSQRDSCLLVVGSIEVLHLFGDPCVEQHLASIPSQ